MLAQGELIESNEDAENESIEKDKEQESAEIIQLGNDLKLPLDYFQFITVDNYEIIGLSQEAT